MVRVYEISPPHKISGLSSIVVQFEYNQYIVDALKTIPTYNYDKKTKLWEFPLCYLGRILDSLTFLDDIELHLFDAPETGVISFNKNYKLEPLSEVEKVSFKASPFPHQLEAVDFLLNQEKSLLLDGCGVGKSLEMILYAETLKKRGIIDHCLVITGIAGLRGNWEREIQKFSTESVITIGKYITRNGTTRYRSMLKRAEQLKNKIDEFFVLLNVESIRDSKIIEAIKTSENKFGLIMFDEIHKCLSGKTLVATELGQIPISDLVISNSPPKVYSYNNRDGSVELKNITGVSVSKPEEQMLELTFIDENASAYSIQCTESHELYTANRGFVKAIDITNDDIVLVI